MAGGYIKLYRQMCDWEWYGDANVFRVFLHLLLNAQHEETRWKGKVIQRGQVVTGRKKLGKILKLSEQQIRTALAKLESTGEITKKSTNEYTIISICKWDNYQVSFSDEQPTNNQRITNEQPTNNHIQECKEYNNNIVCIGGDQNFLNQSLNDLGWLEIMCMQTHSQLDEVKEWLQQFDLHCQAGGGKHDSLTRYKGHFRDWVRYRVEEKNKPKQQSNGTTGATNGFTGRGAYEPSKNATYEGGFGD